MYRSMKNLGLSSGIIIVIGLIFYFLASCFPFLLFYKPKYAKNTQLRGFILTDEQIIQAGNFFFKK